MFVYNPFFNQNLIDEAIQHAKETFPKESVGAIIDEKYVRFQNRSDEEDSFMIHDNIFDKAYIEGKVQAVIHSHDNCPRASYQDQLSQLELDIPFGIINLKNKSVTHVVFWGEQIPIAPLEGRFFFYGSVFDCYSLVRDYMITTYNYKLPNYPRQWVFWYKAQSVFEDHIQENKDNFEWVDLDKLSPGDILLYSIYETKYLNHCAVYMGNNGEVLHHFVNELSGRYPITFNRQYLRKAIRYIGEKND